MRGRLVGLTRPGLTFAATYDRNDLRASKTVNGTTTSFLLDGGDVVNEVTVGVTTATLQGPVTDEPLARGGLWFTPNHLGSTAALTNSSGTVVQSYGYRPFGELTNSPTDSNPFQFTGRENDGSGLLYYRARYYNPAWGRFVSADPSGFAGGLNPFAYAGSNPINATDPGGHVHTVASITSSTTPNMGREGTAKVFLDKGDVYYGDVLYGISDQPLVAQGGELLFTFPISNNVKNPTGKPWTSKINSPIPAGHFTFGPVHMPPSKPVSEGPAYIDISNGMGKGMHGQHVGHDYTVVNP